VFFIREMNIDLQIHNMLKSLNKNIHKDGTLFAFYLNTWRVDNNIAVLRYWGK